MRSIRISTSSSTLTGAPRCNRGWSESNVFLYQEDVINIPSHVAMVAY